MKTADLLRLITFISKRLSQLSRSPTTWKQTTWKRTGNWILRGTRAGTGGFWEGSEMSESRESSVSDVWGKWVPEVGAECLSDMIAMDGETGCHLSRTPTSSFWQKWINDDRTTGTPTPRLQCLSLTASVSAVRCGAVQGLRRSRHDNFAGLSISCDWFSSWLLDLVLMCATDVDWTFMNIGSIRDSLIVN